MRSFKKSAKLDEVCYDIRGPVLKESKRLEGEGFRILKLNIGNPAAFGFNAPDEILHDMIVNLQNAQGYCDSQGLFPARKAIMQDFQEKGVMDVGVDDIFTGNGVSEPDCHGDAGAPGFRRRRYWCRRPTTRCGPRLSISREAARSTISAMKAPTGIPISPIYARRSRREPRRSSSSIRTTRPVRSTRRPFYRTSRVSRKKTSLSSSRMRSTTESSMTAASTRPWRP